MTPESDFLYVKLHENLYSQSMRFHACNLLNVLFFLIYSCSTEMENKFFLSPRVTLKHEFWQVNFHLATKQFLLANVLTESWLQHKIILIDSFETISSLTFDWNDF